MGVPRTASVSCMWMGYVGMICFAVHASSSTLGQLTTRRGKAYCHVPATKCTCIHGGQNPDTRSLRTLHGPLLLALR